jgi:hypothetical protein
MKELYASLKFQILEFVTSQFFTKEDNFLLLCRNACGMMFVVLRHLISESILNCTKCLICNRSCKIPSDLIIVYYILRERNA